METILQKLQTEYPTLSPELLQEFALLLGLGAADDEQKQKELVSAAKNLINIHLNKVSEVEQLNSRLGDLDSQKVDLKAFRAEVAEQLKDKNVPESFLKNAVIIDPSSQDAQSAAAAILTSYKACIQQVNNQQLDNAIRPVVATENSKAIPSDIERFIKSRRNSGPAAGKFKIEDK